MIKCVPTFAGACSTGVPSADLAGAQAPGDRSAVWERLNASREMSNFWRP